MTELLIKNIMTEILFGNRVCESFEDRVIVNYLYEELLLDRLLYGEPITVPELRKLLHNKIVNFEFIKLDGEVRPAKGTTMMKYIPGEQHPKGIRPSSPKVATFYDLEKRDWRSVSQRSKEIVLQKDEDTGKPVIMVKDKPDGGDVAVKPEEPIEEPIEEPEVTVDGKPIEEPFEEPEEKEPEISKVKPVDKTDITKKFYFINPVTGASKIMDITAKDTIKELKKLGKDWELTTQEEYEDREEEIEQKSEEEPEILSKPKTPEKETKPILRNIINKPGKDLENVEAEDIQ